MFKKILLGLLFLLIVIAGISAFIAYQYAFKNNVVLSEKTKYIFIPTYSDINQVVDTLMKDNSLKNKKSFLLISRIKKYDKNIKPGKYQIVNGMNNWTLVNFFVLANKSSKSCCS
jgi:UPF0755 protein